MEYFILKCVEGNIFPYKDTSHATLCIYFYYIVGGGGALFLFIFLNLCNNIFGFIL